VYKNVVSTLTSSILPLGRLCLKQACTVAGYEKTAKTAKTAGRPENTVSAARAKISLSGYQILVRLALPGKPKANTLPRDLAAPESALATLPPLFAGTLLAKTTTSATAGGFRKNDFQVALL
jgi:hypothetical protein